MRTAILLKVINVLCALAILGCVLNPPWSLRWVNQRFDVLARLPVTYAPLWNPPEWYRPRPGLSEQQVFPAIKADQLALELGAIVAVGAFLNLALRSNWGKF
jgi:hypothetical protein